MEGMVFDGIAEYEKHMLPAARQKLRGLKIYWRFMRERERLGAITANRAEQGQPLNCEPLMTEVHALEALGERLLKIMRRLDPYGVES